MFGRLFERVKDTMKNTAKLSGGQEPFQKAELAETAQELVNPDRGWFQIFPFVLGEASQLEVVESCLLPGERLVLVIFDIRRYAEAELPGEALEQMREVLKFFADRKKDIILRVAYDREGKAMEREPSLFQKVSRHMEQIASVTAEFGEVIFVYQGLLIGNWGEMHGSRYLDEKHMASLAALLRDRLRGDVFLAVRTPAQWKLMRQAEQVGGAGQVSQPLQAGRAGQTLWSGGAGQAGGEGNQGGGRGTQNPQQGVRNPQQGVRNPQQGVRMGLFDDAILGSETDRGTFPLDARLREEELFLTEQITEQTPCGGEVVWGEGYLGSLSQEEILWRFSEMHLTYLNRQHDIQVMEKWKSMPYNGKGIFAKKSFYDYVGAHLGYRFVVQDVWMEAGAVRREDGRTDVPRMHLKLQNLGFAPFYRQTKSEILWEDAAGSRGSFSIVLDLREIKDGKPYECSFLMGGLEKIVHPCRVWLLTKRGFDGEVIRFANPQMEDGSVLLGEW